MSLSNRLQLLQPDKDSQNTYGVGIAVHTDEISPSNLNIKYLKIRS